MNKSEKSLLSQRDYTHLPFPHFSANQVFEDELASNLLSWLKSCGYWYFTETSFYMQYEFSLLDISLPKPLHSLVNEDFTDKIGQIIQETFAVENLDLVGITAHKLINGYRMGVHNDLIGKEETHRLVIQLNDGWNEHNGGYLMLFNSNDPNDVARLVMPIHNSGIGFEISSKSYHAVSTIYDFERYTLVYTFNSHKIQHAAG